MLVRFPLGFVTVICLFTCLVDDYIILLRSISSYSEKSDISFQESQHGVCLQSPWDDSGQTLFLFP